MKNHYKNEKISKYIEGAAMNSVYYRSTRSDKIRITSGEAILKGLAPDGGLFVPSRIPTLDEIKENMLRCGFAGADRCQSREDFMKLLSALDYRELAFEVLRVFFTDYSDDELKDCVKKAYDKKFDTDMIAPLVKKDGRYYLELFHGETIAFKDMALSLLPHLMTAAAKKNGIKEELVILTATSGDTGKAALAGFSDVPGTKIIVFYPKNGVSPIQEKLMLSSRGKNTLVVGIEGNFDDAQNGVKEIFSDKELGKKLLERGYRFSSANSINIGRLIPQVVYYIWAYLRLIAQGEIQAGESVNVTVPTGNFGNILAGSYAKKMGVPIETLICASNENKVLFDFFGTGQYDKNRRFILTASPSMDILISSNLERLIFEAVGEDPERCLLLMSSLKKTGRYELTPEEKKTLGGFIGGWTDEKGTLDEIKRVFQTSGYVLDTHTAVASSVARRAASGDADMLSALPANPGLSMIVISTASPYKFTGSVLSAIEETCQAEDDFAAIGELSRITGTPIPKAVADIKNAPVLHSMVCGALDMREAVTGFLK